MAKMKLSDYLLNKMEEHGIKHVFLVSGGGAMHLNDSLGKAKKISYTCNHHEQAAAMAAESYSRVSGTVGVCMVTSGPGGTNAITGVAGAWLDSVAVLFISGQGKRAHLMSRFPGLRQYGVQEIDIISMVKSITKYSVMIINPNEVGYHIDKALYLARHGRPGPVWLDVPLDIQAAIIDTNDLKKFDPIEFENRNTEPELRKQVKETIELLKEAKHPVMIAGMGIRSGGNYSIFRDLVEKLGIPVAASMTSHDLIPHKHPLYAGRFGVFAERAGNIAIQKSDLLLSLESRLAMWETGYDEKGFASRSKKIVVETDKTEFQKPTLLPTLAIKHETRGFIIELLRQLKKENLPFFTSWAKEIKGYQKKYPVVLSEYRSKSKYVNSYYFTDVLSSVLPENETIVTGVGTAFTGTSQSIKLKEGQRLCMNIGCAAMGYDLPAAIGACFANGKKRVILLVGDGGIQMNIQELQTIVLHRLPIKIFVLNNSGYLAIRNTQNNYFEGRLVGSSVTSGLSFPDLRKLSKAYGIPSLRIPNQKNLGEKIKFAIKGSGPFICEIMMDPEQQLIPRLSSVINKDGTMESRPLEDMYPFLSREEVEGYMRV